MPKRYTVILPYNILPAGNQRGGGALGRGIQTGQQSCGGALGVEVCNRQRAPDPEAVGRASTPAGGCYLYWWLTDFVTSGASTIVGRAGVAICTRRGLVLSGAGAFIWRRPGVDPAGQQNGGGV